MTREPTGLILTLQDLLVAATRKERARYEQRLNLLATVAGNAFNVLKGRVKVPRDPTRAGHRG